MKKQILFLSLLCATSQSHPMSRLKNIPFGIDNETKKNILLGLLPNLTLEYTSDDGFNLSNTSFAFNSAVFMLGNTDNNKRIREASSGDVAYREQIKLLNNFMYFVVGAAGGKALGSLSKEKIASLWKKFMKYWNNNKTVTIKQKTQ